MCKVINLTKPEEDNAMMKVVEVLIVWFPNPLFQSDGDPV